MGNFRELGKGHFGRKRGHLSLFQFGWESELRPEEAARLLELYEPIDASWEGNKIQWLAAKIHSLPIGNKTALLKRSATAPDTLPPLAYRDDTKNIELRDGPFSSLEEAMKSLRDFSQLAGVGSLQLTVSQPTTRFFAKGIASAEEQLGWLSFFSERDVLERLAEGQERKRKGYTGELTKNFQHAFLGPLSRRRKKALAEYLRANAVGGLWDREALLWAGLKDRSFKFVGGTAYRPDIAGPERVCFEVRDAHKNLALLESRALRIVRNWSGDLSSFSVFAPMPSFDPEVDFEKFSKEAQAMLERLFPCRAPEAVHAWPVSLSLHQTYRNFAYPLQAWDAWLPLLGVLSSELHSYQHKYLNKIESLVQEESKDGTAAKLAVQEALSEFAAESPLFPAFLRKERDLGVAGGR